MKFYILDFYVNLSRNPIFGYNCTPISVTVYEDLILLVMWICHITVVQKTIFYIVDSDMWFSSSQKTQCCISTAGIVKGTCHSNGYVHCLSCYHTKHNAACSHYLYVFQNVCTVLCCWIFESLICYDD